MRNLLQFTEDPTKYYSKLWKIPQVWLKELLEMYILNKEIWKYKKYKQWFERSYNTQITYRKWRHFIRYYKVYQKRKYLKVSKNAKITKDFVS